MVAYVRAGALAAAALLLTGVLAGCEDAADDKPGTPADGTTASAASPSAAPSADASGKPLPTALTSQRLDWKRCEAPEGGSAPGSSWRCTKVTVPLDYAKPDGDTIGIALIRKEARDKDRRLGSMLFNFGGPGGSGSPPCRAPPVRTGRSTPATTWWVSIRAGWPRAPGCGAARTRSRRAPTGRST